MMANKKPEKRGLGRGLSALMADVAPIAEQSAVQSTPSSAERLIPVDKIVPNKDQPRREFDKEQLQELADSIKEKGIIQPLILRDSPEADGTFQIVAGERRWRAAQIVQLHDVPAIVRDYNDTELLEIAIIENIQRAELNSIEEAAGYRQLMDRFGHTQERIAEALGKSRSHIANLLRLLTLPDSVQQLLSEGSLTAGHARTLVTAENPEEMARIIVKKGLSVRAAEALAKTSAKPKGPKITRPSEKDADTLALQNDLSAALGMKVTIDHLAGQESGKLSISYDTLDDLDRLCNCLTSMK